jgi:hypothetical protein
MTFAELYEIKCRIGRTLFYARQDWEERIETKIGANEGVHFVQFKASEISINITDTNKISVHGLSRKTLRFKYENIEETLTKIEVELKAHLSGEV